jgi:hypothetical protein
MVSADLAVPLACNGNKRYPFTYGYGEIIACKLSSIAMKKQKGACKREHGWSEHGCRTIFYMNLHSGSYQCRNNTS